MSSPTTSDSLVPGQVDERLQESGAVVTAEAVDRRTGKPGHVHGLVSMYVSRCPKGI